jgi:glucosylceramidase
MLYSTAIQRNRFHSIYDNMSNRSSRRHFPTDISETLSEHSMMKRVLHPTVLVLITALLHNPATATEPTSHGSIQVYTTAKDTDLRLTLGDPLELRPAVQPLETEIAIFVNPENLDQTVLGFGGAITDASAEVYSRLDQATQREFMKAYFDAENGLGYSLLRTTIHSSDFGSRSYTYVEEGDKDLKTFDIAPDKVNRIPMIKEAIATAGGKLTTFASPWSAPAFMKDSGNMLQGGKLLPEFRDAWATYFTKFIHAYEAEGIPIWGITVQNEPMATQRWESMIYTAEEERDFLKNHLGPILQKENLGDKKIIVWDHNRDLVTHRANTILGDPEAAKYVWGVGFHWYETWTGGEPMFGNLAEIHRAFPKVNLLGTEFTVEGFDKARYQHWPNAERYGNSIVNDLNAGASGWTDWNILLDDTGGPNHVSNVCFAPIHADRETGELIYTPTYYYLGHFSKFIRPNARRVSAVSSRSVLQTTSFVNSNQELATVVLNLSDEAVSYRLFIGSQETSVTIPARAMQTLLHQLPGGWTTDFFDDFDTFNADNWQDQMIWVNNEKQCYVPDNKFGTREVSDGTLKVKVVNIGNKQACDNCDKKGDQHPETEYAAGRICSKNKKEFVKGRWTARLRMIGNGKDGMFPAWWILGAQNNEPPVQEPDENVPWPLTGSGEIDIFEHYGAGEADHFTTGAIKCVARDNGDWKTLRTGIETTLDEYHEYSVEWAGSDLVYRVDGAEVHRNVGEGDNYPEPMFAILNYAKITDAPMTGEWVMEVDWVKHEFWDGSVESQNIQPPANLKLIESDGGVQLNWDATDGEDIRYNVYRATESGKRGQCVAEDLTDTTFTDSPENSDQRYFYSVTANNDATESYRSDQVLTAQQPIAVPSRIEAESYAAVEGAQTEDCGDSGGGKNLGHFDPDDFIEYEIRVDQAGQYTIDYRLASETGSEGFEVLVGEKVIDKQAVPKTGGWQTYQTQSSQSFSLSEGQHKLRFRSVGNQWNLNWFEVKTQ